MSEESKILEARSSLGSNAIAAVMVAGNVDGTPALVPLSAFNSGVGGSIACFIKRHS